MTILIELTDITSENFFQCVYLKSSNYQGFQLFEEHLASNAFSIAQSKVEPEWEPFAINHNNQIVGFCMYGYSKMLEVYFVNRLMIDYKYQGQGIGRKAMQLIIEDMKKYKVDRIYTSIVPTNSKAMKLYESLGFMNTGRVVEYGEEIEPLFEYMY